MKSLEALKNALESILPGSVSRYEAHKQEAPYIVLAEDTQADSVWSDDGMTEQAIEGTIDLYTKDENDPLCLKIQLALNSIKCSYRYNSTQYERDTKLIHHEWVWEIWL